MQSKKHMVQCRFCKKRFDAALDSQGLDWIMPSKNWYYHMKCYKEWCQYRDVIENVNIEHTDAYYHERILDFLWKILKAGIKFELVQSQISCWKKKYNYTTKGIYYGLIYFYQIKNNPWNPKYEGIGIIPYIYDESKIFWADQEEKQKGFLQKVDEQMRQLEKLSKVVARPRKRERWRSNFEEN